MDVYGSRPELGSSQKRNFGFRAMARAMPTRFCIPPLSSLGYLSSEPITLTFSRQYWALSFLWAADQSVKNSIGNITFSITVAKSKRALPWKRMPMFWRSFIFSLSDISESLCSPYDISPLSGSIRPIRFFRSTVLPEPLAPMIILHLPGSYVTEISFRTCTPSKLLLRFSTFIISVKH